MLDGRIEFTNMFTTSKTVIINEDTQCLFLIDVLVDIKKTPDTAAQSKKIFSYAQVENSNKKINLFECNEVSHFLFQIKTTNQ